jgi:ATP-dependent DNA helicase PIF1
MNVLPIDMLSNEQMFAFECFKNGDNLFITGPGGSGKTQLIHTFIQHCKTLNKEVAICALTGCASVLLNMKAKTIHSWSGIKLAKGPAENIIHNVLKNRNAVSNWKKVKVLIVDEISMMSVKIFELLEELARRVRRCPDVFGGIQIVFTGDFYQLPPVGDGDDPLTSKFCFESKKWKQLFPLPRNSVVLVSIFRQKDPKYCEILNQIRVGELTEENALILQGRVIPFEENGDRVITRLFPIKNKVELINQHNFQKLEGKKFTQENIVKTNCTMYLETGEAFSKETIELCNAMTAEDIDFETKRLLLSIPVSEKMEMKKGSVVMLTVNLCVDDGLCNGSQGIIVDILENQFVPELPTIQFIMPVVRFNNGITIPVGPHFWQNDFYPRICVSQIPLVLAWAMTIHKIQGASLDIAQVDAGCSIFEYGQTYVGLSRVRSLQGLYLTNFKPNRIKTNPLVKEFYKTILPVENQILPPRMNYIAMIDHDDVAAVSTAVERTNDTADEEIPVANATEVNGDDDNNSRNIPMVDAVPILHERNTYMRINKLP